MPPLPRTDRPSRPWPAARASLVALLLPITAAADPAMHGSLGAYPMNRDTSGTSWQPDDAPAMAGAHVISGEWMIMTHGEVMGAYTDASGPRGEHAGYQTSMLMAHASRAVGEAGVVTLRGMGSLEPLEGPRGYPLLFQTGETADGRTPLIDRQHPHNLLMEAAIAYSQRLTGSASAFAYAGLAGEPALGPTAFMHRYASMWNAEAPLTHHWLDSTHVTYGTTTAGVVCGWVKIEASAFNGREPDQHRYAVELRRLDSWAARLTLNPGAHWSVQLSRGRLASPEQLAPAVAVTRTTASATYHVSRPGLESETLIAWGRNAPDAAPPSDGYLLDEALTFAARRTLYMRLERVSKDDLLAPTAPGAGTLQTVGKATLGASLRMAEFRHAAFSLGAQASLMRGSAPLDAAYGHRPTGGVVYLRVTLVP